MSCGAPMCTLVRGRCESCERRARYGFLAVAIGVVWEAERDSYAGHIDDGPFLENAEEFYLNALDALAGIMEDRKRLIGEMRRLRGLATIYEDGYTSAQQQLDAREACDLECGDRFFKGAQRCRHGRDVNQSAGSLR